MVILLLCAYFDTGLTGKGKDSDSTNSNTCSSYSDSENYGWKWWMTSGWWKKYYKASDLHFNAGDLITCNIPDQNYIVYTPKHHLLATSSRTVAHSWGFDNTALIREEDWTTGPSGLRDFFCNEICWVQPKDYAKGLWNGIQRARNDVEKFKGETVYYDLLTCNCEHWVRKWMYDSKYSRQSSRWSSKDCPM